MLREFVKNKELMKASSRKKGLPSHASVDSDASEGSTLVSTTSDPGAGISMLVERKRFHLNLPPRSGTLPPRMRGRRQRITHHTLVGDRGADRSPLSDSASDTDSLAVRLSVVSIVSILIVGIVVDVSTYYTHHGRLSHQIHP